MCRMMLVCSKYYFVAISWVATGVPDVELHDILQLCGLRQGGAFLPLRLLMSEEQAPTAASFSLETLTHALELLGDMPQLRLDSPVFLWSASHISFVSLN